jgi:predicted regulator of Ras-like GTPase activity (Roadblock/LC7/MglB family)
LRVSEAKCALLIDKDGHLVTGQGHTATYDVDTVSALVAGSFAATRQMAKLMGEEEFSVMFHQGKKDNIQLSLVGDRTILAVIFDDRTTVGMVRHYANQVAAKLAGLFQKHQESSTPDQIDKNFSQAAKGRLDDLFGK